MIEVDRALSEYLSVQEDIIESIFRKDGVEEYQDTYMSRRERFVIINRYVKARWWIFLQKN